MVAGFDRWLERVSAGESLSASEIAQLAASPDILPLGMLADAARRHTHGTRVTYLRIAEGAFDGGTPEVVPSPAREVRITGSPASLDRAVAAVARARTAAGDRTVSGFAWPDIARLAREDGAPLPRVLERLRQAGLDALASVPLDALDDAAAVVERLAGAGFERLRLGIVQPGVERVPLIVAAASLQERFGCIQSVNPLASALSTSRPTTGYDDVKMVALARLAAPNIPIVQVDWSRYGPKLAQVSLTFGADDLDAVTASDEAPDGRRRAPLEDVHRNITAAGLTPAERDGRFRLVA